METIELLEEYIYGGHARSQEEWSCLKTTVQTQPSAVVPPRMKGEKRSNQETWKDLTDFPVPWTRDKTGRKYHFPL